MKPVPYKEPLFTFAEVLDATGASDNWLRTFIHRDKDSRLGTKHRTGRLLFSLKDIAAIGLLHRLNANLRVTPAAAWEVVDAAEAILAKKSEPKDEVIRVGFDVEGGVLIWTIEDGVVVTWNDKADTNQFAAFTANQDVHIVVPLAALFAPVGKAVAIAQRWPEDAA